MHRLEFAEEFITLCIQQYRVELFSVINTSSNMVRTEIDLTGQLYQ